MNRSPSVNWVYIHKAYLAGTLVRLNQQYYVESRSPRPTRMRQLPMQPLEKFWKLDGTHQRQLSDIGKTQHKQPIGGPHWENFGALYRGVTSSRISQHARTSLNDATRRLASRLWQPNAEMQTGSATAHSERPPHGKIKDDSGRCAVDAIHLGFINNGRTRCFLSRRAGINIANFPSNISVEPRHRDGTAESSTHVERMRHEILAKPWCAKNSAMLLQSRSPPPELRRERILR